MKQIISGIYQIVNIRNKKLYIGSACDLNKRKIRHFSKLKTNNHVNKYLQNAFNLEPDCFKFFILEICERENLIQCEQKWLDVIYDNQENCYNIASSAAAPNLGRKTSEETKLKLSLACKGKKKNITEEARQAISDRMKGNKIGLGIKRSEESIQKTREFHTGKRWSLGRKRTDQEKLSISNGHKLRRERKINVTS